MFSKNGHEGVELIKFNPNCVTCLQISPPRNRKRLFSVGIKVLLVGWLPHVVLVKTVTRTRDQTMRIIRHQQFRNINKIRHSCYPAPAQHQFHTNCQKLIGWENEKFDFDGNLLDKKQTAHTNCLNRIIQLFIFSILHLKTYHGWQ